MVEGLCVIRHLVGTQDGAQDGTQDCGKEGKLKTEFALFHIVAVADIFN